ncbi:MAG: hypothetical protein Tsb009_29300 [Planctomycetaceae bacterium]
MATLPGRLGSLQAKDIMTPNVTLIRESDSLSNAVQTLRAGHITGAPVVNNSGILVGILSISDLMETGQAADSGKTGPIPLASGNDTTSWQLYEQASGFEQDHGELTVGDRMSRTITSVQEETCLVDVARTMCDGHWHRVPVVDANGSLQGIISTMDILAAVVNAADEAG